MLLEDLLFIGPIDLDSQYSKQKALQVKDELKQSIKAWPPVAGMSEEDGIATIRGMVLENCMKLADKYIQSVVRQN